MTLSLIIAVAYFNSNIYLLDGDFNRYSYRTIENTLSTNIGVEVRNGLFGAVITTNTLIVPRTPVSYAPYNVTYISDFYITKNNFTLGWEHMCTHPILSGSLSWADRYSGGYDKFYIKGKVTLQGGR